MLIFDTICALSTPPYKSALAIVRMSGDKSLNILSNIIKRDVSSLKPNYSFYSKIFEDKKDDISLIDEAVITFYKAPKSFTGFDIVEFSLHGSMIIVDKLLKILVKYGARLADKGEFTAQAFYMGKMDLLKAEGINDLINARSLRANELALQTMNGKNSELLNNLKESMLSDIASLEYFVEDSWEDEENSLSEYNSTLASISSNIQSNLKILDKELTLIKDANNQYFGIKICILGEPNVGKSTLLNCLLNEDKAIVSDIPGTTRDIVEGDIERNGILYHFYDTAGLRESNDKIEIVGIKKSLECIKKCDVILLLSDVSSNVKYIQNNIKIDKNKVITIKTKSVKPSPKYDFSMNKNTKDFNSLYELIDKKVNLDLKNDSYFLGEREEEGLRHLYNDLIVVSNNLKNYDGNLAIISDGLRICINDINSLIGLPESQTMEDIYDTLFSKFCLGK